MIPLKDENPTRVTPYVTVVLMAACVVIYFFVQPVGGVRVVGDVGSGACDDFAFNLEHAAIPYEITEGRPLTEAEAESLTAQVGCPVSPGPESSPAKSVYLAVIYSMFLHGSLLHLAGNMLYLWVFGNNIEDTFGKPLYVAFYLVAGVVATATHVVLSPSSPVPIVGASGAIAGVMGAYLVLFPRVPIRSLIIFFIILFRDIEARWLLGFWFVSQFFISPNSGVAWAAHVGGFVAGVVGGLLWRALRRPEPAPPYRDPFGRPGGYPPF